MKVTITPTAFAQLEQLREPIYTRLLHLIERLQTWPAASGAKPLSGKLAGHYRMRTGDYRLQFVVKGETIIIEKVGKRDRFYED